MLILAVVAFVTLFYSLSGNNLLLLVKAGETLFDNTNVTVDGDLNVVGTIYGDLNGGFVGDLNWSKLTGYPGACPVGEAVTAVGDVLTCAPVAGADTNWVTGWSVFDSNMKATYLLKSQDTNCAVSGSCSLVAYLDRNNNFDSGTLFVDATHNNVGIGTTTPSAKLDVYSTSGIGVRSSAASSNTVGSRQNYVLRTGTSDWYAMGIQSSNGNFVLDYLDPNGGGAAKANVLTINSGIGNTAGNVGIGTTAPTAKLDINSIGEAIRFIRNDFNSISIYMANLGGIKGLGIYNQTAAAYRFWISESTGNVGIGTTQPSSTLHLYDDYTSYQGFGAHLIVDSSNGYPGITFADTTESVWGIRAQDNSDNDLQIWRNSGTGASPTWGAVMAFDRSSGNVGIGTTSPSYQLDINSGVSSNVIAARSTGTNAVWLALSNTAQRWNIKQGVGSDLVFDTLNGGIEYALYLDYDNGYVGINDGSPTGYLDVNGAKLFVASDGNIGIGTASPNTIMHISKAGTPVELKLQSDTTNSPTISMYENASLDGFKLQYTSTSNRLDILAVNSGTISTTGVSITRETNLVGIGTLSPSYPLHVDSNVSNISIYADANISAMGYITHTQTFDKTRGSALSFIKDADQYRTNGRVDDTKFSYSKVVYNKTIPDKIIKTTIDVNECTPTPPITEINPDTNETMEIPQPDTCRTIQQDRNVQTFKTIQETGVSIDSEIALLKQAIYELKTELCTKDNTYEWC